jgi:hypothetical protein
MANMETAARLRGRCNLEYSPVMGSALRTA